MKLKQFLENINTLVEQHPHILEECDVVFSADADDELNHATINKITYQPTLGHLSDIDFLEVEDWDSPDSGINAICIN